MSLNRQPSLLCNMIWLGIYSKGVIVVECGTLHIKVLTESDINTLEQMDTGIKDDYVLRIFPDLIKRENNVVYGLFEDDHMISIAGYTLFANQYAMLGRLRSDRRYTSQGHATNLLRFIIRDLEALPNIKWIGAHTEVNNEAAKKVMSKLGIPEFVCTHPLVLKKPDQVVGTEGPVWNSVRDTARKRELIENVTDIPLGVFPYEGYYPVPFDKDLFTDDYLERSSFYVNETEDRFIIVQQDQKGRLYANVKYLWDDHHEQPGFWETVQYELQHHPDIYGAWIDFSPKGYQNIPSLHPYEWSQAWVLYGKWV